MDCSKWNYQIFTRRHWRPIKVAFALSLCGLMLACASNQSSNAGLTRATAGEVVEEVCQIQHEDAGTAAAENAPTDGGLEAVDAGTDLEIDSPDDLSVIGCTSDFNALASLPMDVTVPGARSVKFIVDTQDTSAAADSNHRRLYFQNSVRYPLHVSFACKYIAGVPCDESQFLDTYYSPNRRFLAGSVTHYENLNVWALEMAPYDTATAPMIKTIFDTITPEKAFFRPGLVFHPTSDALADIAPYLDLSIPITTTDQLFVGTDYQPLVRATAYGVVTYYTASEIQSGTFIPYNSIVVLDEVPNDISVVAGVISEQFQSPLSHVNILCTNRGTPNMGLKNAKLKLQQYEGTWVRLTVAADQYMITPVDAATGEAAFEAAKASLPKITLPEPDLTVQGLYDIADVVPNFFSLPASQQRGALDNAVHAFGGKAIGYSVVAQNGTLPVLKAFAFPVYYYDKFMKDNGYYDMVQEFQADPDFTSTTDSSVREQKLTDLRNAMMTGTIDQGLQDLLKAKLKQDYTGTDGKPIVMRFRTSTNSEDLEGFPCAGCYESHTGDPADWDTVLDAIRQAYSSAWLFRTYEERSYYGVDHLKVAMAIMVHSHFTNELCSGVAVTNNPYDSTGTDPAYYVNAVAGSLVVEHLPAGVTTDQFLYYPDGTTSYIASSNTVPAGTQVMTNVEIRDLATALATVQTIFSTAYNTGGWYAMDVEWKVEACDQYGNPTNKPVVWLKQARPYPNPNQSGGLDGLGAAN